MMAAPIPPIIGAIGVETTWFDAVIATNPAKEPLIISSTSGRRCQTQLRAAPTNIPDVPAKTVLTIMVLT